jgi:hypothetical protein
MTCGLIDRKRDFLAVDGVHVDRGDATPEFGTGDGVRCGWVPHRAGARAPRRAGAVLFEAGELAGFSRGDGGGGIGREEQTFADQAFAGLADLLDVDVRGWVALLDRGAGVAGGDALRAGRGERHNGALIRAC